MKRTACSPFVGIVGLGLAVFAAACASDAAGPAANLGIEGASCQRTPDCAAPLQCIRLVCTRLRGADAGGGPGADDLALPPDAADATGPADLVFQKPDTPGPADAAADPGPRADAALVDLPADSAPPDGPGVVDLVLPPELQADWTPVVPDVESPAPELYGPCSELAIADAWSGTFEGFIAFHDVEAPDWMGYVPSEGLLVVDGTLAFDIDCLEQKLIVAGTLSGYGVAEGEPGRHPFAVQLRGEYNPLEQSITAELVEGEATLFYVVKVFFEGTLTGRLQPSGNFTGTWLGESTGNNFNMPGEAEGGGSWQTQPGT